MAASSLNIGSMLKLQGNTSVDSQYKSVSDLFNNILPNVYVAAGIVIFFMVVMGGFMILTNAGNADKTKEGSKIITSAIIGLLVVFASYWLIQIIQVLTGIQIINSSL
jgi:hypothetical protein